MCVVTLSGLSAVTTAGNTLAEQMLYAFVDFKEAQKKVVSNLFRANQLIGP